MQNQNPSGLLQSLEHFAELTSQVIFSYDIEANRFNYLNPAFEQVWKKTRKSAHDNPALLLESVYSSDKEYIVKEYKKIINGEIKQSIEFRIILPDKSVRWLCLNAFIDSKAQEATTIAGSLEDITSLKEMEEYTKKFIAKKNSVLEILAHDLAGPLNNINLASSLVAEKAEASNDPELHQIVDGIKKTSERSIHLIREFLAQEFLESTNIEVIKNRVDMVKSLKEVVKEFKNSEDNLNKNFSLHCSEVPIYMQVDDNKLRQAITNLISNALKFTPDGGKITVSIEEQQEVVMVTVADNGIGIPSKYHDTLFEKFTKARRKGLKGEHSNGLGMSIIKTIVQWHGGKIWFQSQENKGTTFYIELPKE